MLLIILGIGLFVIRYIIMKKFKLKLHGLSYERPWLHSILQVINAFLFLMFTVPIFMGILGTGNYVETVEYFDLQDQEMIERFDIKNLDDDMVSLEIDGTDIIINENKNDVVIKRKHHDEKSNIFTFGLYEYYKYEVIIN